MTDVFSIIEFPVPEKEGLKIKCSRKFFENGPFYHKTPSIRGHSYSREHG